MINKDGTGVNEESSKDHQSTTIRRESVLERLGNLVHGHHGHPAESRVANDHSDPMIHAAMTTTSEPTAVSKGRTGLLFHVVLTSSHFHKDVNSTVQAVRVCGTYTSLRAATIFAHRCLFDAGYEAEWFASFTSRKSTNHEAPEDEAVVCTTGPDGEEFTVSIKSDANLFNLQPGIAERVETPLYHVIETLVHYLEDQSGQTRETRVKASFPSYDDARKYALTSVMINEDLSYKTEFEVYEEAQPGEVDCGYGENVIVHAVGQDGMNFLVSVLKGQEMEVDRVTEAAMRMR